MWLKIIFVLHIFLSQYCAQKYLVCTRLTKSNHRKVAEILNLNSITDSRISHQILSLFAGSIVSQHYRLIVAYGYCYHFYVGLEQAWANLFGSRATLETNSVLRATISPFYGIFNFTFKVKWVFSSQFSKKKNFKRNF